MGKVNIFEEKFGEKMPEKVKVPVQKKEETGKETVPQTKNIFEEKFLVKKKDGTTESETISTDVVQDSVDGTENTRQSTSQLPLEENGKFDPLKPFKAAPQESPEEIRKYNKTFEEVTGYTLPGQSVSKIPLNDKQKFVEYKAKEADVLELQNQVYGGTISAKKLSELYQKPHTKKIVEKVIESYTPQLGKQGWDESVFRNEVKWDALSRQIKKQNRTNAVVAEEEAIKNIDKDIANAMNNYQTTKLFVGGGTGGGAASVTTVPLKPIDINDPTQYSFLIDQLNDADQITDKSGKPIPADVKEKLLKSIYEKQKYFVSKTGIDPELKGGNEGLIDMAVARSSRDNETGEERGKEFWKDDKVKADQFKLGLSYVKNVNPAMYKNVVRAINEKGRIADQDFRDISSMGQEIYNAGVFRGAAKNPNLIDAETNIDYTTRTDKKAQYAKIIGERLKQAGYKNVREFDEDQIRKVSADLTNKDILEELINEEKIPGYDAIPKTGGTESFVRGILQPISGLVNTGKTIIESPAETYLRSKKLDTGIGGQKVLDDKGNLTSALPSDKGNIWYDALSGFGQFIPQVLLTKGIGGVANKALGTTGALAKNITTYGGTGVSTYLQTYGDAYASALEKTGDPATARLMGNIDAVSSAAFELILPDVKIADKAVGAFKKNLATDLIGLIKKGGDPQELATKARPIIQKFVKETINTTGQEVAEEVGTNITNFVNEAIFSPRTAQERDLTNELVETAKATAISMIIPAVLGGGGAALNKDFTRNGFNAAAINLSEFKPSLQTALDNKEITQDEYNKSIQLLSTHKQSIEQAPRQTVDGRKLSNEQQLDYAFNDTLAKVYKENALKSEGVTKELWENKLKAVEEIQRNIVMPKDKAGQPVEENVNVQEQEVEEAAVPETEEKVPTADEVEVSITNELGEEKAKEVATNVVEFVDNDLLPQEIDDAEKQEARERPLGFLKAVAEQAQTPLEFEGKTIDTRERTVSKYGEEVVKLAEEAFPLNKEPVAEEMPPQEEDSRVGDVLRENGFIESKDGGLEKDGIRIVVSEGAALGVDKSGDVFNVVSSNPKDIVLKEINVVDETARGKGNATQVLRDFLASADKAGNTIFIEPAPIAKFKNKNNLTEQQLIKWYERHGFEKMNDKVWRRKPNAKLNENESNNDYENRLTYEEADRYRESIRKGEMTADEAKKVIEGMGNIVPKDIREQSLSPQEAKPAVSETEGKPTPKEATSNIFEEIAKADKSKISKKEKSNAINKVAEKYGEQGKKAAFIHANFDNIVKQLKDSKKLEVICK